jgi:iron complex transport system ATP-binding protein
MSARVTATDLRYAYPGTPALDGMSFSAAGGEVVGVLGPNGAGKSTLIRILAGLLRADSGSVRIDDLDPASAPRREVARRCAWVAQEPAVAWPFTVREVVMMGRAPHQGLLGLARAEDLRAVSSALAACDLVHLADRRVDACSGGERRRVFIARALAQSPRVLLLDEPTAFLDLGHQLAVLALARAAARDGLAVIAVLHDLNLAASSCDRLLLLDRGKLVAEGPPREVLTEDRVREIWGVPVWRGAHGVSGAPIIHPA